MTTVSARRRSVRNRLRDLRGAARLGVAATLAVTDIVESMHANIARVPPPLGPAIADRTGGITGLVYRSIRGVTRGVGGALEGLLAGVEPLATDEAPLRWQEDALAALNGVMGDYLEATANPLAILLSLHAQGQCLTLTRDALAASLPQASDHLLVLVHGLCLSERHWDWHGHDHGRALAQATGCTPVYVRYNTGRHVSSNGRDLADNLAQLVGNWPVPVRRLTLLTHSMGGLVARSAVHYGALAGHSWRGQLTQLFFLGTPHHGAPLERGGHWIDQLLAASPYTAALARLGHLRSAGITDLRHGSVLETDWQGADRFARRAARPARLALPAQVRCYALAASLSRRGRGAGDGLVPLRSALGEHSKPSRHLNFAPDHLWIGYGLGHLDLLGSADVCQRVQTWMTESD